MVLINPLLAGGEDFSCFNLENKYINLPVFACILRNKKSDQFASILNACLKHVMMWTFVCYFVGRGGSDGCKVPMKIDALQGLGVIKVECGSQFSVALTKSGAVYTW